MILGSARGGFYSERPGTSNNILSRPDRRLRGADLGPSWRALLGLALPATPYATAGPRDELERQLRLEPLAAISGKRALVNTRARPRLLDCSKEPPAPIRVTNAYV